MKKSKRTYIRLEPSETFDKAIVKTAKDGCLTYSYKKLVECVLEGYDDPDSDESFEQALDYVDYNIVGLQNDAQYFKIVQ